MMTLQAAKETLKSNEISDEYFLKLHITVECMLKRFLFIGLRQNGVAYKTAQETIKRFYESNNQVLSRIWKLFKTGTKEIKKDKAYDDLEKLFINFSSVYRNYRFHGIYPEPIDNKELLKALIEVDKRFLQKIESLIYDYNGRSLFDKPNEWGKTKTTITDLKEVFETVLVKAKLKDPPPAIEEVKKTLKAL